ncbi:MAG: sigma-54-dependent Fis family transcriptional regulator, partial [Planctomycetaceae bacterium]|nr:sigma-54-dependent Fis family transcriptional regulator [Planctomycetaceae bacterium]
TGKELVARAIHNLSPRSGRTLVKVNCASLPANLIESELFGHEKGAFTGAERRRIGRFEQCDGGTIFLDEIGDMSPIIQGKVLRLLQEQKFERVGGNELITTDVRIIAATNRPLEQMVESEDFREDLLYRLNGFTIPLPPLRDRREDIPLLLEYFLRRAKSEMNRPQLSGISPNALELLVAYNWPGNIRQLQSVVRQALLNTTGTVIDADNLPSFVRVASGEPPANLPENFVGASGGAAGSAADSPSGMPARREYAAPPNRSALAAAATASPAGGQAPGASNSEIPSSDVVQVEFSLSQFIAERLAAGSTDLYAETLEQVERRLFTRILEATAGNQSKSAEILGITRGKVRDRIAAFEIHLDRTISVGK